MRTCGDWLDEFLAYFPKERKPMRNCPLTKHNWQMVCVQCGKIKKDGYVRIPFKEFEAMMKEPAFQEIYNNVRDCCYPYSCEVANQEVERGNVS